MLAMVLYGLIVGGLLVLLTAGASAFREAVRRRARLRGYLAALAVMGIALVGLWAMLI